MAGLSFDIRPAGAGTAAYTVFRTESTEYEGDTATVESFQMTAEANFPYTFDYFEWEETERYYLRDGTLDYENTATRSSSNNPCPTQTEGAITGYYPEIGKRYRVNGSYYTYEVSTIRVYFKTRTPTNLLVNSANRSTPVKLVYDPATNLLVADY